MIFLAGIAAFVAGLSPAAALQGALSVATGLEYDSNANRAETAGPDAGTPQGSPLLRLMAMGRLQQRGPRHLLNLQLTAGGKVFFFPQVFDQNIGVVQLGYEEGAQFQRLRISAVLDYHDAYQAPTSDSLRARDFRAATTGMRLSGTTAVSRSHRLDATLDLSGVLFMYKPASQESFVAPSAQLRLASRSHAGDPELGHDIEVGLSGRFDYRGYFYGRQDDFIQTGATLDWAGRVLLQIGYTFQLNLSNVNQESYQRHLVLAKGVAALPLDLTLTVKGQINLLRSHDPFLETPIGSIDEENRSLAMLDLERPLRRGFSLSARYTGYFDVGTVSGSDAAYQRHTVCLTATYRYTARRKP